MHFTISPMGSAGDVHPFIGLALKLQDRGHDITFVVHGYFEDLVRKHGLEYVEFGTKEEFLQGANNPDLWHPIRSFPHIFRSFIGPNLRRHHQLVIDLHQQRDSVIIASVLGMGARVAQDSAGIPLVSVHLQPSIIYSNHALPEVGGMFGPNWMKRLQFRLGERFVFDGTVRPTLNPFRSELGLPPVRRTMQWWHSPELVVCMFPDWFAPRQPDWPPQAVHADFPLWDDGNDQPLADEVETFLREGSKPIAFTPGSAHVFGEKFFRDAVEACQRLNRRGILLSRFPEHIPSELPPTICHVDYAPYAQLLPHVAASVHHGGVGTMAQGLAAGVPQLITAMAHDQFDNGSRIKTLGVGDWLNIARANGKQLATRLQMLLESKPVAIKCDQIADRCAPRNGLDLAADEIEQFARDRRAAS